ncbi:DNA polymerase epsilon subunit 4 isoform X1 [Cydia pomonella]|uniref:DNA polymerase epsilon subunit 4 isoform X1 n=1 Tax=Cydia pomonella TaxID=82600 RepID=UPI002ADDF537|nr:DNA polymerase epsilon subunit 4 isoform X1 [Cydia pomonella]
MTESQHYTDIDISDVIDDTEQYADTEQYIDTEINSEPIESEILQESELVSSEEHVEKKPQSARSEVVKATRLPIARIKNIMKQDPDVSVISADAAFLVTKATELFLETIVKETYNTSTKKKKIITKKDLDYVINMVDCLCFLEGAMDF